MSIAVAVVRTTAALGAIVLACALGSAAADEAPGMSHGSGAGQTGAEIYVNICQGCHMPEGQGATGAGHYPSLGHDDTLAGRLGEIVATTVVLNGRNGMPAFGHLQGRAMRSDMMLSDAQVAEVVNYVRTHFGNHYPERMTAAQVAAVRHPTSAPSLGF